MKRFIKNSYLFLIFFIILVSKDYVLSFFVKMPKVNIKDSYVQRLEQEIADINIIKNNEYKSNYYYAKVLYQNPYKPGYINIAIDDNKIKKNDYVIHNNMLLGTINKVYKNRAEVKLINASDFIMQVSINDCYGILRDMKAEGINKYCPVDIGDEVYTSNLGYIKDKVLIGTVVKKISDKNEISDVYEVKSGNTFSNLNYLIIIGGE